MLPSPLEPCGNPRHGARRAPLLSVASIAALTKQDLELVSESMAAFGYAHLFSEDETNAAEALGILGTHFGGVVPHNLSAPNGVHPIAHIPGLNYANTTCEALHLHTDGSFEQNPPKVMLIYCERPSPTGGETRLAWAEDVYSHLAGEFPDSVGGLFRQDAFRVTRGDRCAQRAVFSEVDDRLQIAFRSGAGVSIRLHPDAQAGFAKIESFLSDPRNYVQFRLERKQAIVVDNTRMLHGRAAFGADSKRQLWGLWCDGESRRREKLALGFRPTPAKSLSFPTRRISHQAL